jgi:hypothetical protein
MADEGSVKLRSSLAGANRVFAPLIVMVAVPSALLILLTQLADGEFIWRWSLLAIGVLVGMFRMYWPMYAWIEIDHATIRTKDFWTRRERVFRLEDVAEVREQSGYGQKMLIIRFQTEKAIIRFRPDDMTDRKQLVEALESLIRQQAGSKGSGREQG